MEKVQKEIEKFNEERDWDQFHSPENLAKSIAIEAGELLECFQWNTNFDKDEVCDELADVFSYCSKWRISSKLTQKESFLINSKKHEKNILLRKQKA